MRRRRDVAGCGEHFRQPAYSSARGRITRNIRGRSKRIWPSAKRRAWIWCFVRRMKRFIAPTQRSFRSICRRSAACSKASIGRAISKGFAGIVAKLFNILTPQIACFGQKDYQQFRIISAMTEALDWPIQIVGCPTLRDPDGLAMSSRNQFLLARRTAAGAGDSAGTRRRRSSRCPKAFARRIDCSRRCKTFCAKWATSGESPFRSITSRRSIRSRSGLVETVAGPTVLAVAARVGATRLIDNLIVEPK